MDRGAWRATVHGATKSWIRLKQLTLSFNTEKRFDANSQMGKLGRNRRREIKHQIRGEIGTRQRRKSSSH